MVGHDGWDAANVKEKLWKTSRKPGELLLKAPYKKLQSGLLKANYNWPLLVQMTAWVQILPTLCPVGLEML